MLIILRKIFALFLVGTLLSSIGLSSLVMFSFKVNQLEIIQKYCVNKNQPEIKCDGKCYLADQLKKTREENNTPGQMPETEDLNIHVCFTSIEETNFIDFNISIPYLPSACKKITEGFVTNPFHPPKSAVISTFIS